MIEFHDDVSPLWAMQCTLHEMLSDVTGDLQTTIIVLAELQRRDLGVLGHVIRRHLLLVLVIFLVHGGRVGLPSLMGISGPDVMTFY